MPFTKTGEYIFDKQDKKILKIFADLNGSPLDGWDMMMMINPKAKSKSEKDQCYKAMDTRIKNIYKLGIIKIKYKKDGKPVWEISDDRIEFKRIKTPSGFRNFIGFLFDDDWYYLPYN